MPEGRMLGMTQPKHKVSVSLPADLVAWIDRQVACKRSPTRSGSGGEVRADHDLAEDATGADGAGRLAFRGPHARGRARCAARDRRDDPPVDVTHALRHGPRRIRLKNSRATSVCGRSTTWAG